VTKCIKLGGRVLLENIDRRLSLHFVVYLDDSTEKIEVKSMKFADEQLIRSAQSWIKRVERKHQPKVDYHSELRDWVRHVILKAEKNKNFQKKDQFLSLLEDLDVA
jgi:hypothetical protein